MPYDKVGENVKLFEVNAKILEAKDILNKIQAELWNKKQCLWWAGLGLEPFNFNFCVVNKISFMEIVVSDDLLNANFSSISLDAPSILQDNQVERILGFISIPVYLRFHNRPLLKITF